MVCNCICCDMPCWNNHNNNKVHPINHHEEVVVIGVGPNGKNWVSLPFFYVILMFYNYIEESCRHHRNYWCQSTLLHSSCLLYRDVRIHYIYTLYECKRGYAQSKTYVCQQKVENRPKKRCPLKASEKLWFIEWSLKVGGRQRKKADQVISRVFGPIFSTISK